MLVRAASDKIDGADEASQRGEAGMPHWGLKLDLPDQLLVAISAALEDDFHPGDADKLLALTEALAATFDPGYH